MLGVVMSNLILQSVVMLNVIMLNAVAPTYHLNSAFNLTIDAVNFIV